MTELQHTYNQDGHLFITAICKIWHISFPCFFHFVLFLEHRNFK